MLWLMHQSDAQRARFPKVGKPGLGGQGDFLFPGRAEEGFLQGDKGHPVTKLAGGIAGKEPTGISAMQ